MTKQEKKQFDYAYGKGYDTGYVDGALSEAQEIKYDFQDYINKIIKRQRKYEKEESNGR